MFWEDQDYVKNEVSAEKHWQLHVIFTAQSWFVWITTSQHDLVNHRGGGGGHGISVVHHAGITVKCWKSHRTTTQIQVRTVIPKGLSVFEAWDGLTPPKYPSPRVFIWALVGNARTEVTRATRHGSLNWLRANIQRIHLCTLVLDPSKNKKPVRTLVIKWLDPRNAIMESNMVVDPI